MENINSPVGWPVCPCKGIHGMHATRQATFLALIGGLEDERPSLRLLSQGQVAVQPT
jgi:hypothetical protein